jgi:hypothetical protein
VGRQGELHRLPRRRRHRKSGGGGGGSGGLSRRSSWETRGKGGEGGCWRAAGRLLQWLAPPCPVLIFSPFDASASLNFSFFLAQILQVPLKSERVRLLVSGTCAIGQWL